MLYMDLLIFGNMCVFGIENSTMTIIDHSHIVILREVSEC